MTHVRTALIIGGGVAGPVAAMAMQRAGIDAVVYEAHGPTTEEVGSYLTVATNGLDALRAIDAHEAVLAAGFPTPVNVLMSSTGRRLGAASNGGRRTGRNRQPYRQAGAAVPGLTRGSGRPRHRD